jgi:PTH1 family peptidyl-tRNA hydrolase
MADIFDLFRKISTQTPSAQGPVTHLIVGLGNPGNEYFHTRHNAGFLTLDYVSQKMGIAVNTAKFHALVGDGVLCGKHVMLIKPQTYMNSSGEAVREAAQFYHISPENIFVVSDDINLDVGRLRVREKGSDGGQKGLRSIIYHLNSDNFPRIRVGIGQKPNPNYDLADWVLSKFTPDEQKILFDKFETVLQGIEKIINGDVDGAMSLCNTNTKGTND